MGESIYPAGARRCDEGLREGNIFEHPGRFGSSSIVGRKSEGYPDPRAQSGGFGARNPQGLSKGHLDPPGIRPSARADGVCHDTWEEIFCGKSVDSEALQLQRVIFRNRIRPQNVQCLWFHPPQSNAA